MRGQGHTLPVPMGLIHVTVTLRSFDRPGASYEADFLVDTGATDSMAPARELRRIGVTPVGRMAYELADGSVHDYAFGLARIEFMGEVTAGRVLFGPDDAEPLLGVTALESIGITIDPVTRTLKRLPAIPLKSVAARELAMAGAQIAGVVR
jgi:clan AA aspartic protease